MWCKRLEKACFSEPAVVELSKKFIWVYVDRDVTPALPKKFNVSAYPSLITLGAKQEKIHRFSAFKEPEPFMALLKDALRRYELYQAGKEWDTPEPRPEKICDEGDVSTFKAPTDAVPGGLAWLDGFLWLVQDGKLRKLDPASGEVQETLHVPAGIQDLATDGTSLFALDGGWTAGRPILELDPKTGKVVREIVTEANKKNKAHGAKGVEWLDGRLYVLEGMQGWVHEVDPTTGEIAGKVKLGETWLTSLAHDGTHWIVGSRSHVLRCDPKTGEVVRKVAVNYPLRSVACGGGSLWLMEQPVFDYDKDHQSIRLWPRETQVYRLTMKP